MKFHPSIKSYKFCPQCGSNQHLAAQPKKIECSNCQFCFYFNPACAVAVIIENELGEILALERNQEPCKGLLDLPGGFVDPFETAEEAASREIKEELNVFIKKFSYLTTAVNLYTFREITYQTVDIAFHTQIIDLKIELNEENNSFIWLPKKQLLNTTFAFDSINSIIKTFTNQN